MTAYSFWPLLGFGFCAAFILFTLTWLLSLKLNNFSFVDVTWSYSLALIVPWYAIFGKGQDLRQTLAVSMAVLWSIRLGSYLLMRVSRHHPEEDVRYKVLRKNWKDHLARNFFGFFQAQALLSALLSVPFLLACLNPRAEISTFEIIGFLVWLIGLVGEGVSDAQMGAFKKNPANRGKVCQEGLWYYSRHPNYFFESLTWWGVWIFACGSPWGWITIYAPLMILYSLLRITGIPLTEKCSVESKGDAYRKYQETTSAFIPWKPKK